MGNIIDFDEYWLKKRSTNEINRRLLSETNMSALEKFMEEYELSVQSLKKLIKKWAKMLAKSKLRGIWHMKKEKD